MQWRNGCEARGSFITLCQGGLLGAAALLSGCLHAPGGAGGQAHLELSEEVHVRGEARAVDDEAWSRETEETREARRLLSEAAYCPLARVHARILDPTPPPPPEIAADTERFAMWREAAKDRLDTQPKKFVVAVGCGEHARFACWPRDHTCMEVTAHFDQPSP
jgi:hypothetical protein